MRAFVKGFCDYVLRDIHFMFRKTIAKGIKAVPFRGGGLAHERARSGSYYIFNTYLVIGVSQ